MNDLCWLQDIDPNSNFPAQALFNLYEIKVQTLINSKSLKFQVISCSASLEGTKGGSYFANTL